MSHGKVLVSTQWSDFFLITSVFIIFQKVSINEIRIQAAKVKIAESYEL